MFFSSLERLLCQFTSKANFTKAIDIEKIQTLDFSIFTHHESLIVQSTHPIVSIELSGQKRILPEFNHNEDKTYHQFDLRRIFHFHDHPS